MLSLAKAMSGDREAVVEAADPVVEQFHDTVGIHRPAHAGRGCTFRWWSLRRVTAASRRRNGTQNEIFDFIKQSYLLTANAMQEMVGNLPRAG